MTVNAFLSPSAKFKGWANDGTPLAFGKLYTYAAGTNNPIATYPDSTASTPNQNPITLDFRGECNLFLPPNIAFKYLLTDSGGNQVYTQDQVVISQLITLYGGVDTGTANAYVLNYTANFTALTDGIVIYFIASNTNTGASTLNVNGLGVVPIVQQNGNPLSISSIIQNTVTQVMYVGGNFLLLTAASTVPQSGSFALAVGGLTNPINVTVTYSITGTTATIVIPFTPPLIPSNPSNANTFTLSGLPAFLQPAITQQPNIQFATDNGSPLVTPYAQITPGSSIITLFPSAAGLATSWTATGTKILGKNNTPFGLLGNTLTYALR